MHAFLSFKTGEGDINRLLQFFNSRCTAGTLSPLTWSSFAFCDEIQDAARDCKS